MTTRRPPESDSSPCRTKRRRPRIVVEGAGKAIVGQSPKTAGAHPGSPLDYPVQLSKVQAPPLRDETLARMRLLDWLDVKIHSRVVFVIADAGYGKTTLLADLTGRSTS